MSSQGLKNHTILILIILFLVLYPSQAQNWCASYFAVMSQAFRELQNDNGFPYGRCIESVQFNRTPPSHGKVLFAWLNNHLNISIHLYSLNFWVQHETNTPFTVWFQVNIRYFTLCIGPSRRLIHFCEGSFTLPTGSTWCSTSQRGRNRYSFGGRSLPNFGSHYF